MASVPRVSESVGPSWSLGICISIKFTGDADAAESPKFLYLENWSMFSNACWSRFSSISSDFFLQLSSVSWLFIWGGEGAFFLVV